MKSAWLSILHKIAIRLPFPVFPVIQANLQLVPARNLNIALYLIGGDLLVKSTEYQDAQNNKTNKSFTQAQLKRFEMNPVHMKSLQAQTKNKTQKSLSNHLRHKYFPICSCPALKVLRWIGQWMMVYTIDSLNGAWSVRTFWSVSLPCYQKRGNARKWLHGVVILAWTSMFLRTCPQKVNTWYHLGKIWRILQAPIKWSQG